MKPDTRHCIVTLEVTCWAFSIGGEHYTGYVRGYKKGGEYHQVEVSHKLTAKQALALNKKDDVKGGCGRHKPGGISGRFDTRAQIERAAIATYKKKFPDAVVLNLGDACVADVQKVLVGPDWFKDGANEMYSTWEKERTEYSATLTETGEIYDTAFVPKGHGSDVKMHFDSEGNVSLTPVTVNIPERYAIVFKCQHGKFVIDGDKAKGLYNRFNRGDRVIIQYREIIRVHLTDDKETSREVYGLDFLDAIIDPKFLEKP